MKLIDSFLEIAGNLGFLVGNNDRRRERDRKARRTWGVELDGYAVSLAASTTNPSPNESLRMEVVLRNASEETRTVQAGSWLIFFPLEILTPQGSPAQLSSFGKFQWKAAQGAAMRQLTLKPGEVAEAEIPVGALFELKRPGVYSIVGHCAATRAISNQIQIRI